MLKTYSPTPGYNHYLHLSPYLLGAHAHEILHMAPSLRAARCFWPEDDEILII